MENKTKPTKKTVKPTELKNISAKDLFFMSYPTRELYTAEKIDEMKNKLVKIAAEKKELVRFFENDGIIFYLWTFTELIGTEKGKKMTVINCIKDWSAMSGGDMWKFGYVNSKTGTITFMFDGNYVAKGRKRAYELFNIATNVATKTLQKDVELIPFAHKN